MRATLAGFVCFCHQMTLGQNVAGGYSLLTEPYSNSDSDAMDMTFFVQYSAYLVHFCGRCIDVRVSSFQITRSSCFSITAGMTKDFTKRHRQQHLKCRSKCVICGCRLPACHVFFPPPHSCHIYTLCTISLLSLSISASEDSLSCSFPFAHMWLSPVAKLCHVLISFSHSPTLTISPDPIGRVLLDLSTSTTHPPLHTLLCVSSLCSPNYF